MNQYALDFLSIPCLHGEIKFQHNFPKKYRIEKLALQTRFFRSAKFSHSESMDQMQSIKVYAANYHTKTFRSPSSPGYSNRPIPYTSRHSHAR